MQGQSNPDPHLSPNPSPSPSPSPSPRLSLKPNPHLCKAARGVLWRRVLLPHPPRRPFRVGAVRDARARCVGDASSRSEMRGLVAALRRRRGPRYARADDESAQVHGTQGHVTIRTELRDHRHVQDDKPCTVPELLKPSYARHAISIFYLGVSQYDLETHRQLLRQSTLYVLSLTYLCAPAPLQSIHTRASGSARAACGPSERHVNPRAAPAHGQHCSITVHGLD